VLIILTNDSFCGRGTAVYAAFAAAAAAGAAAAVTGDDDIVDCINGTAGEKIRGRQRRQ